MLLLLSDSLAGLQHLIDAAVAFCDAFGMTNWAAKTQTMASHTRCQHPLGIARVWRCSKEGSSSIWRPPSMQQEMTAAWAFLRQQYGYLEYASSVGLLHRVY